MIINGDSLKELPNIPDNSIDSIVTDPPYELGFMGKKWDNTGIAYNVNLWRECLRVLKPGGHLLAFGGTRTYHRMAVAIEDAGFEIRDSLHWLYGSGFPKSLNVGKAIDKAAGAEREVVGTKTYVNGGGTSYELRQGPRVEVDANITAPATDAAKQWQGWGTALKPAHEPIVVARKPLIGTVAANVLEHGTGALNIDGCRVGSNGGTRNHWNKPNRIKKGDGSFSYGHDIAPINAGRWPANLVFTHAAECGEACAEGCPVAELDGQSGVSKSPKQYTKRKAGWLPPGKAHEQSDLQTSEYNDTGGASRFFTVTEWDPVADVAPFRYVAKPSKRERNAGLDRLPEVTHRQGIGGAMPVDDTGKERDRFSVTQSNHHPTVKPVNLMRWLVRLVTPPGGTVLDPFAGSGTTLVAAELENLNYIGIEMTEDYIPIIKARITWAQNQQTEPTLPLEGG